MFFIKKWQVKGDKILQRFSLALFPHRTVLQIAANHSHGALKPQGSRCSCSLLALSRIAAGFKVTGARLEENSLVMFTMNL